MQNTCVGKIPNLEHLSAPTIELVRTWLRQAEAIPADPSAKLLAKVLKDPQGLKFTVTFVDGVIRPEDYRIAAHNFRAIVGFIPHTLPVHLQMALHIGARLAPIMPRIVIPIARRRMRKMVSHLIIDARPTHLSEGLEKIATTREARLNVNLLSEAVLGANEASKRVRNVLDLLNLPGVDYVSLKVSSIVPPQAPWAFEESVKAAKESLRPIFVKARNFSPPKFINLDMEEYHDVHFTIAVFTQLMDEIGNENTAAGIVLQAYLPDALSAMQELQSWAKRRVERGGSPIKVRLVKGANLPMEKVQADIHDWPLATLGSKQETDTQYKRVLEYALRPEHVKNIRLGIAGHNLFDIAFAWLLAKERGVADYIEFEMLLGMAPNQVEAMKSDIGKILLYTPVVHPQEFDVAIAYLIRRLEEGASAENFMSAVFDLYDNPELFEREKNRFLASLAELDKELEASSHRVQNRFMQVFDAETSDEFKNTPDSDPSTLANIHWATEIFRKIRTEPTESSPHKEIVAASQVHDVSALHEVIDRAVQAHTSWAQLLPSERAEILHKAGRLIEKRRGEFITVMAQEAGKTIEQADPEVSEAIDFAHYYAYCSLELHQLEEVKFQPDQLILVTSPWNFPVAIPCGSTIAALATGASVILKPAPQTPQCASLIVQALWDAGVPKEVLQLLIIDEDTLGEQLISDSRIKRIILTGSWDTAVLFRSFNPTVPILAETSGKNAIVVTGHADYDLAAKDIAASAFGHAGQKCSAASLLILVGSIAHSQRFRNQLLDAVQSLKVGFPGQPTVRIGPLIEPASGKLLRGLTELDPGESWLLTPQKLDEEGRLWSPGIRAGVAPRSWFHKTELFGPVLGIINAKNLEEAIAIQNEVDYGLTAGLHSLDRDEIYTWIEQVEAGNLYVNRGITGAIVQRQPFGGWKKSSVGNGYKAGGPNYLLALGTFLPHEPHMFKRRKGEKSCGGNYYALSELGQETHFLVTGFLSDAMYWENMYGVPHDVSGLASEQNIFRYVPRPVHIHLAARGNADHLLRVVGAGLRTNAPIIITSGQVLDESITNFFTRRDIGYAVVEDEVWVQGMLQAPAQCIRLIGDNGTLSAMLAERLDHSVHNARVTASGRLELLHFLKEQAISITAHRFGNPIPLVEL